MADLTLTRHIDAAPEEVFAAITNPASLLRWWGPEGTQVDPDTAAALDFTRLGPWESVMVNGECQRFKVSGQVTHVDPPNSVGFTWAWHDGTDTRGHESHVTLSVKAQPTGGTLLHLSHVDLADADSVRNHEGGWSSSLARLADLF